MSLTGPFKVQGADGNFYGPATASELNQWAGDGRIIAFTVLIDQTTNQQVLAKDLPSLAHHFHLSGNPQAGQHYNPSPPQPGPMVYGQIPAAQIGSSRNQKTAALLAFFLGIIGAHRFYLGYTGVGLFALALTFVVGFMTDGLFLIVMGMWSMIEFVRIITGLLNDAEGQPLS